MMRQWFSRLAPRTPTAASFRPSLCALEDRATPAVAGVALAAGAAPGSLPVAAAYNADGSLRFTVDAYDAAFTGGVHVAAGDVTGDGVQDLITAAGTGGGPHVKIFNGVDATLVSEFMAYDVNFRGGAWVAAGDTNNDGRADIITGAGDGGGPHVKVFSGADGSVLNQFMAYDPNFRGGVRVAAGDIDADGTAEIFTGAGTGGGPHLRVLRADGSSILVRLAYAPEFRGGMFVGSGDVNGDGRADILTGADVTGGPHVRVFSGADFVAFTEVLSTQAAFNGVNIAAVDLNDDGRGEVITGAKGTSEIRIYELDEFNRLVPSDLVLDTSNTTFKGAFEGGTFVG
jgi:hypothetical protein